jgi:dTDP-4-amino-4,6-dideoxygalactose transaminase
MCCRMPGAFYAPSEKVGRVGARAQSFRSGTKGEMNKLDSAARNEGVRQRPVAATPTRGPVREREDFLVFGAPQIVDAEVEEVVASMRAAWLGTGPKVARFEDAFRAYKGGRFALAVNSCTAALHLSVLAAGVGPGDEVVVPALTFCATANAVIHSGGTPVVADVDPVTMNITAETIDAVRTERTRAVIPVHFAGRPCAMDGILALADGHDLTVIEDCAHAVETEIDGRKAGTLGDLGCFSFYATKNVTTGEGGMVITDRADFAEAIKVRALHGMTKDAWKRFSDEGFKHYQVVFPGFKYNMMDLQAAIGIHQLARVEENWLRREHVWGVYQEALADTGLGLPADPLAHERHAYHLYTVLVDEKSVGTTRDDFLDAMTAQGIGVGVHYLSLGEHPYYREALGWNEATCPEATRIGRQTVSLPLSPALSDRDVADVLEAVHRVVRS